MVRISDILKQRGEFPEGEPPGKKKSEEPAKEKFPDVEAEAEKEMQMASAIHQTQLDPEESKRIYQSALEIIKEILGKREPETTLPDLKEAYEIVEAIVDRIVLGDKELVALTVGYSEDNYLYAHLVNVCILSIDLGLGLGYNQSKLNELGMGALLHDLGMAKVMDIAKQQRRLDEQEVKEIRKHPIYGSDMLTTIQNIQEGVIYVAKQQHERINGRGYPEGLKDDQIHEYAKIVAVVDVYEALTHPRPYHKALESHEAIKELLTINSSGIFDIPILKILINKIGIYPVGSWVELNTGEIGKVIASNEDLLLRPKVNVIFSPEKKKLPRIKLIDLSVHTNVYIKHSINPQELDLKFE